MEKEYELINGDYIISTDKTKIDIDAVHNFLSKESYWAPNIPKHIVEKAIAHSICFGVYNGNTLVGFARAITDTATFAYLADVFIVPQHRGKGLSKWLMQAIHAHPQLQGLRRMMLTTKDAHGLYAQFNWLPLNEDLSKRIMLINKPDIYKNM